MSCDPNQALVFHIDRTNGQDVDHVISPEVVVMTPRNDADINPVDQNCNAASSTFKTIEICENGVTRTILVPVAPDAFQELFLPLRLEEPISQSNVITHSISCTDVPVRHCADTAVNPSHPSADVLLSGCASGCVSSTGIRQASSPASSRGAIPGATATVNCSTSRSSTGHDREPTDITSQSIDQPAPKSTPEDVKFRPHLHQNVFQTSATVDNHSNIFCQLTQSNERYQNLATPPQRNDSVGLQQENNCWNGLQRFPVSQEQSAIHKFSVGEISPRSGCGQPRHFSAANLRTSTSQRANRINATENLGYRFCSSGNVRSTSTEESVENRLRWSQNGVAANRVAQNSSAVHNPYFNRFKLNPIPVSTDNSLQNQYSQYSSGALFETQQPNASAPIFTAHSQQGLNHPLQNYPLNHIKSGPHNGRRANSREVCSRMTTLRERIDDKFDAFFQMNANNSSICFPAEPAQNRNSFQWQLSDKTLNSNRSLNLPDSSCMSLNGQQNSISTMPNLGYGSTCNNFSPQIWSNNVNASVYQSTSSTDNRDASMAAIQSQRVAMPHCDLSNGSTGNPHVSFQSSSPFPASLSSGIRLSAQRLHHTYNGNAESTWTPNLGLVQRQAEINHSQGFTNDCEQLPPTMQSPSDYRQLYNNQMQQKQQQYQQQYQYQQQQNQQQLQHSADIASQHLAAVRQTANNQQLSPNNLQQQDVLYQSRTEIHAASQYATLRLPNNMATGVTSSSAMVPGYRENAAGHQHLSSFSYSSQNSAPAFDSSTRAFDSTSIAISSLLLNNVPSLYPPQLSLENTSLSHQPVDSVQPIQLSFQNQPPVQQVQLPSSYHLSMQKAQFSAPLYQPQVQTTQTAPLSVPCQRLKQIPELSLQNHPILQSTQLSYRLPQLSQSNQPMQPAQQSSPYHLPVHTAQLSTPLYQPPAQLVQLSVPNQLIVQPTQLSSSCNPPRQQLSGRTEIADHVQKNSKTKKKQHRPTKHRSKLISQISAEPRINVDDLGAIGDSGISVTIPCSGGWSSSSATTLPSVMMGANDPQLNEIRHTERSQNPVALATELTWSESTRSRTVLCEKSTDADNQPSTTAHDVIIISAELQKIVASESNRCSISNTVPVPANKTSIAKTQRLRYSFYTPRNKLLMDSVSAIASNGESNNDSVQNKNIDNSTNKNVHINDDSLNSNSNVDSLMELFPDLADVASSVNDQAHGDICLDEISNNSAFDNISAQNATVPGEDIEHNSTDNSRANTPVVNILEKYKSLGKTMDVVWRSTARYKSVGKSPRNFITRKPSKKRKKRRRLNSLSDHSSPDVSSGDDDWRPPAGLEGEEEDDDFELSSDSLIDNESSLSLSSDDSAITLRHLSKKRHWRTRRALGDDTAHMKKLHRRYSRRTRKSKAWSRLQRLAGNLPDCKVSLERLFLKRRTSVNVQDISKFMCCAMQSVVPRKRALSDSDEETTSKLLTEHKASGRVGSRTVRRTGVIYSSDDDTT